MKVNKKWIRDYTYIYPGSPHNPGLRPVQLYFQGLFPL